MIEFLTSPMILFSSSCVNLKTDPSPLKRRRAGGEGGGGVGKGGSAGDGGAVGGSGGIEGEIMRFARESVSRSWSRLQRPASKNPVPIPMPATPKTIFPVDISRAHARDALALSYNRQSVFNA